MNRPYAKSFFAIEVISLRSFHDQFFGSFPRHGPLAAVGVITGITRCTAATGIIGDHVINKILIAGIAKLMCLARLEQKRVAWSDFSDPILVANVAAAGNDKIKLRFRRVRVITGKAICLSVSALARDQTDGASTDRATPVRAPARPKCSSSNPAKLSFRRFFFLLGNVFEIDLSHLEESLGCVG